MEITELGAFDLAEKIKNKDLSPVEVVEAYIRQNEEWNPKINAMVESFFDQAREDASKKEKLIMTSAKKDLPPLLGVPFSAKEMLAVKGAKRTAGSKYSKDIISDETATTVERIQKAGGILLGTTNVPELGFWFETENVIYGRTNNPHNLNRTCGGSSGGEGALVAARGSAFGLGSDIGGSIRIPAAFCGIFGHKPSSRLVPITGHYPFVNRDMHTLTENFYPYTTIGPLARTAQDLHGILKLLAGPDGLDPQTRDDLKIKPLVKDLSGLKIFTVSNPVIFLSRRAEKSVVQAMNQASTYLSEIGCEMHDFPEDLFVNAVDLWFKALSKTKTKAFVEHLNPHSNLVLKEEFFKLATFNANHTFPSLVMAVLERFSSKVEDDLEDTVRELQNIRAKMADLLGENGVLLFPPHPRTAPVHRSPYLSPFDFIYAGIFNVLEFPATECPIGLDDEQMPTGVQIVGNYGQDHLTISVAAALESAFGGSIRPSGNP